jgi:hypothetical protein
MDTLNSEKTILNRFCCTNKTKLVSEVITIRVILGTGAVWSYEVTFLREP